MKYDIHAYWHKWSDPSTMLHKYIEVESENISHAYNVGRNTLEPLIKEMRSEWNFLNWVATPTGIPIKSWYGAEDNAVQDADNLNALTYGCPQ